MLQIQQDDKPFRLVVSIIRGTNAGRALSMMANGSQCCAATYDGGLLLYKSYLDAAFAILENVAQGICFGVASLIHVHTGRIYQTSTLMGLSADTTLGAHQQVTGNQAKEEPPPY